MVGCWFYCWLNHNKLFFASSSMTIYLSDCGSLICLQDFNFCLSFFNIFFVVLDMLKLAFIAFTQNRYSLNLAVYSKEFLQEIRYVCSLLHCPLLHCPPSWSAKATQQGMSTDQSPHGTDFTPRMSACLDLAGNSPRSFPPISSFIIHKFHLIP